uniref:RING-type domain-containing protein n=1 Tax=Gopherus evgoodei TaxID=1825980 RepID=A0A8C4Y7T7_9SAUR
RAALAYGDMATDNPVESLQEEATCSICLEYFKDPVTADCGHNFYRVCIAQCWERPDTDVSCPQCRETVRQGNKPQAEQAAGKSCRNSQTAEFTGSKGSSRERVCEEHQETLKLQISLKVACHECDASFSSVKLSLCGRCHNKINELAVWRQNQNIKS